MQVSGGTVSNTTDISASANGGTAIADASGGDYNVSGTGNGGGGGDGPTYAGPGDPCWSGVQCVAADTALTCDYNAYTDDYRCCAYEGDRCGWDGGCCGSLSCNDNGFCVDPVAVRAARTGAVPASCTATQNAAPAARCTTRAIRGSSVPGPANTPGRVF